MSPEKREAKQQRLIAEYLATYKPPRPQDKHLFPMAGCTAAIPTGTYREPWPNLVMTVRATALVKPRRRRRTKQELTIE